MSSHNEDSNYSVIPSCYPETDADIDLSETQTAQVLTDEVQEHMQHEQLGEEISR